MVFISDPHCRDRDRDRGIDTFLSLCTSSMKWVDDLGPTLHFHVDMYTIRAALGKAHRELHVGRQTQ